MNIISGLLNYLQRYNMAQIKLELKKEKNIPHKVIIKMEKEEASDYIGYAWQEENKYNDRQYWKLGGY